MKKILVSMAVLGSMVFADGAAAVNGSADDIIDQEGFYAGLAINAMSSRDSRVSMNIFDVKSGQDRLGNINLVGGYIINDYLAVEGRYGTTFSDEDRVELDSQWSLFIKPMYKFENDDDRMNGDDYIAVYALLGYGGVSIQGVNGLNADVDDNSFQWGIGVSYTFRESSHDEGYSYRDSWTIFADYTYLGRDMDGLYYNGAQTVDADAFTIGLTYKF